MNTITVQRANVVLRISPEAKEKYLAKGYSVIDEKGTILEASLPSDPIQLQGIIHRLEAELEAKDKEIASLKKPARKSKTTDVE